MINYLIFGFDIYYPLGGMNDLLGSAETLSEAKEKAVHAFGESFDRVQILNVQTGKAIRFIDVMDVQNVHLELAWSDATTRWQAEDAHPASRGAPWDELSGRKRDARRD